MTFLNKKFILIVLLILIATVLVITSLGRKSENGSISKSSKLQVVASFYPLYFFSSVIGGEKAEVVNLTPFGVEPHDYDPTTADIARIEKSNMVVLNGGVEVWGDKIRNNLKGTNVEIINTGKDLFTEDLSDDDGNQTDSHVWLSPILAKKQIETILGGFIRIDLQNKDYYISNTNKLINKMTELDNRFRTGLSNCSRKDIVTSHAAFGYLTHEYGIEQIPISGFSPNSEPSARQLTDIVKLAKVRNIRYIFFESLVSPKLSETIANEIGAGILVLDPLEGLSEVRLKSGNNYFTVMEENLNNLKVALQCSS